MTRRVVKLPNALNDLDEAADYIRRQGGPQRAIRFLSQADIDFEQLARMPGLGVRFEPDDPAFADLRVAPVARFKNYLLCYGPVADGIEVLRVPHGARDLHGLLAVDLGIPEEDAEDAGEDPDAP